MASMVMKAPRMENPPKQVVLATRAMARDTVLREIRELTAEMTKEEREGFLVDVTEIIKG